MFNDFHIFPLCSYVKSFPAQVMLFEHCLRKSRGALQLWRVAKQEKLTFLVLSTEKRVRRRNLKASAMDQWTSVSKTAFSQRIWLGSSGFTMSLYVTICHYDLIEPTAGIGLAGLVKQTSHSQKPRTSRMHENVL